MEIIIRPAQPQDSEELCKIDSICSQGKSLIFHYHRDNFFIRSQVYRKWVVFVAQNKNILVGMVAACVKKLKIGQHFVPVGYIYDLRVHPEWRQRGISYELLKKVESYLHREEVQYAYTYVIGENHIAKKISTSMGMYPCSEYSAFLLPCFNNSGINVQLISSDERDSILPDVESYFNAYDLRGEKLLSSQYREPGPLFRGTWRLSDSMNTIASVWDSSILSTKVVDRVPLLLRLVNKLGNKVKKILHIPGFPGLGEKLVIRNLFDIYQKKYDPVMLKEFICGMQGCAGREGVHMLMVHVDTRDEVYKTIKSLAFLSVKGHVLMRTPVFGVLPPALQCIYFDVRDF